MIDNAIAIYCFLDDYLKAIKHKEDKQNRMNDAEVMLTAFMASFYFGGHHENALKYMCEQGLCKRVLSKSRFNRRLHAIEDLAHQIFQSVGETLKQFNTSMKSRIRRTPIAFISNSC